MMLSSKPVPHLKPSVGLLVHRALSFSVNLLSFTQPQTIYLSDPDKHIFEVRLPQLYVRGSSSLKQSSSNSHTWHSFKDMPSPRDERFGLPNREPDFSQQWDTPIRPTTMGAEHNGPVTPSLTPSGWGTDTSQSDDRASFFAPINSALHRPI